MNNHEPIRIKPLRLRGVYGIAWMIYKRGFASMFLLTVILYGIAMLATSAISGGLTAGLADFAKNIENWAAPAYGTFGMSAGNPFQREIAGFSLSVGLWMLSTLLGLGFTLVLQPMTDGGLYTEASARIYGRYSGLRTLLRRSKFMLRRFFTTNLCLLLANWAVSMVASLIVGVLVFVAAMARVFSAMASAALSAGAIAGIAAVVLAIAAVYAMGMSFLFFTYPVAVNEGLKNFKAIERSFKLVSKRFGRMFGVSMTLAAVMALSIGLVMAVLLSSGIRDWPFAVAVLTAIQTVLVCLCMPYVASLFTVLYFDARVRLEGEGWLNYPEPSLSEPAAPVPNETRAVQ